MLFNNFFITKENIILTTHDQNQRYTLNLEERRWQIFRDVKGSMQLQLYGTTCLTI